MTPEEFALLGCPPDEQDVWPQVSAEAVRQWYRDNCPGLAPLTDLNILFNENVAQDMGFRMESQKSNEMKFDGYETFVYANFSIDRSFVTTIYEFKNTQSNPPFNKDDEIDQALGHIDYLVQERNAIYARYGNGLWIATPTYVVVTTSPESQWGDRLDRNNEVYEHARKNNINLVVYRLRSRAGDWYLDGTRLNTVVGDFNQHYASIPNGDAPKWLQWLDPTRETKNCNITMTCNPQPEKVGRPTR